MTERIYLENPYLREINARVIDKQYIDNKFYLKLDRTIFYPNLKGGQPRDKGTINGLEVIDVYEDEKDIVHVIGENIFSDRVQLSINWNTRLDYMQQHSGQHLISSIFYKLYNAETVGFYIGKTCVYIDITIPQLKKEDVIRVENFANNVIYSNFDIKTYTMGKGDVDRIPIRKDPDINSDIRIVEIDGMDYSPCSGTHHRSTGEIGMIKIRNWKKYKGNIRVEFVCGKRALKDYTWKNDCINNISTLLSSKDIDSYKKVEDLYYEKEKLKKENRDLKEKLLKYMSKELLKKRIDIGNVKIIYNIFNEESFKEISYITTILKEDKNIICLFGMENEDKCQFILSKSKNIDINMDRLFKEIEKSKNIKGGGNAERVQGKCEKADLKYILNSSFKLIESSLKGKVTPNN